MCYLNILRWTSNHKMRKHVRYEYNLSAKEKEKNPLLKGMRTKLLNIKPVVDYHRFSFIITGTMHIQTNQNVPYGRGKITRHRVMNIHEQSIYLRTCRPSQPITKIFAKISP